MTAIRRRTLGLLAAAGFLLLQTGTPAQERDDPPSFEKYLQGKRWEEAEADAQARLSSSRRWDPEAAADLAEVILASRQRHRYDEAVALLERAVSSSPEAGRYHFLLGQLYGAQARSAGIGGLPLAGKTRAAFTRAVELEPSNFEFVYALNEFLLEAPLIAGGNTGRARKAAAAFERFDRDAATMLQARILIHEKAYVRAIGLLRALPRRDDVTLDATRRNLLSTAGLALLDEGRASETVDVFEDLASEFPNNAAVNLGLGRARLETGDTEGAVDALEHAVRISRNPEGLYRLGLALLASGDTEGARPVLRESLEQGAQGRNAEDIRRRLAAIGG